jgi:hypothetical protein
MGKRQLIEMGMPLRALCAFTIVAIEPVLS